ncbi:MAG: potassium channel family protein [Pseudomonadota bacterium]
MPFVEDVVDYVGKQRYLAVSLICYLLADAFVPDNRVLTYAILAMLIVSGPLATGKNTLQRVVTISLALLMVTVGYYSTRVGSPEVNFFAHMIGAAFFLALIVLISRALLVEQTRVTGETLWAAINVYVLFGMLFAFLYSSLLSLNPGAFAGGILEHDGQDATQSMVYYSFVTMTTLGYGDITPKTHVAATLAYVQALIGQLYVAILIARLVSMYNAQPQRTEE